MKAGRIIVFRGIVVGLSLGSLIAFCLPARANAEESSRFYREGREHVGQGRNVEAVRAFRKAADEGDAAAIDFLGWMYLEGRGVPKSPWIAFGHFMDAAAKGNDQACRNLGNMYFNGVDIDQDYAQAAKWWEKGAKRGSYRAAASLAQLLFTGDGVPVDKQKAIEHWAMAAQNAPKDDKSLAVALAFARIEAGKPDVAKEARNRLKTLAERGNRPATDALKYLAARENREALLVEIPFVHQAYNHCGVASGTMALRHQGCDVSQFDVKRLCPRSKRGHGVFWSKLLIAAEKCKHRWRIEEYAVTDEGFEKGKTLLLEELSAGRPVIIDWLTDPDNTSAHSVVLCGYDKGTKEFLFRNPALTFPGIHVLSEARFKEIWRSRGYIPNNDVVRRPLIRIVD